MKNNKTARFNHRNECKICSPEKNILNPKISVVTCTFNSQAFLQKTLESIENQTYKNIEHIINDSYSTDTTLEIVRRYIERNKDKYEIKLFQSEPKGVANALNVATGEATGELIHYLHSDDYYLGPDSLEKVAARFMENPDLVWLTGNFLVELKGKRIVLPQTYLLQANLERSLSVTNIISHENTFMKREAVLRYGGFNEDKADPVEYSLWLKLIKDHKPLIVNDEFTVFVIHKGSTSTGNIFKFSKAVLRGFHTQRKERIFPLVGYYGDKRLYGYYRVLVRKVAQFVALIRLEIEKL